MERPLIAVVGDVKKCKNPSLAKRAAEELGDMLAKRKCRILVYSSSRDYVEWEIVSGYLRSKARKEDGSIEVRYPAELDGRFEGEKPDDPLFVRVQPPGGWEASIYPSFAELDALILIGGTYTAKIAGFLAVGSKTPVLALGGHGGAAEVILNHLKGDRNSISTAEDLNLMSRQDWTENSAALFVDNLLSQIQRKADLEKRLALGESEQHRKRSLTILALVGSGLFVAVLLALVEAWASQSLPRYFLWILFGTPAVAGASGAAIRVLWDNFERRDVPLELRPIAMTVALGFWASGVAGTLFLLPQIWVLGKLEVAQGSKLAGFAVPIGLLAGLTLDKVFPRLIKSEVPLDIAVPGKKAALPKV